MKHPGHRNGERAAEIRRIVHVACAQIPAQIGHIARDEPSSILRDINMHRLQITIKQTAEAKSESKPDRDEQRPQRNTQHPTIAVVNEARYADQQTNWESHPP